MKYNFNFVQEEQYRTDRLITNKNNQHVDIQRDSPNGYYLIKKINENEEIPKIVWNFSKYEVVLFKLLRTSLNNVFNSFLSLHTITFIYLIS